MNRVHDSDSRKFQCYCASAYRTVVFCDETAAPSWRKLQVTPTPECVLPQTTIEITEEKLILVGRGGEVKIGLHSHSEACLTPQLFYFTLVVVLDVDVAKLWTQAMTPLCPSLQYSFSQSYQIQLLPTKPHFGFRFLQFQLYTISWF